VIEIDDAGSGSLIGGTGIGLFRRETQEYIFKIIPPVYFQEPYFSQKAYQKNALTIVKNAFRRLEVSRNEPVRVCRGYIFEDLHAWLNVQGYNWRSVKIEGTLQSKVEASFSLYCIQLGLPRDFVQHARFAFGFHRLLKWVFADFDARVKYCKSGWKSWRKWSVVPRTVYPQILDKEMYCLKCGQVIPRQAPAVILAYETNREWTVPLHPDCCSYEINLS
jgi:hypothetical protein